MIKRLPSRNQRSKSITVKHILQICLLLGVCFWLAYQVKRSHDKKREFEENDANALFKTQIGDEILKLGRKDLNPLVGGITKNHKNEDEEEDELVVEDEENKREEEPEEELKHEGQEEENKHEEIQDKENKQEGEDQGEEENKHEVEDQDDEDSRSDETEDEGKGGRDEEIDESDQEKSEAEMDRDDEFVDGEKEKEESDDRENEKGDDKESLVENQNTHEAREENYKADDASSAVTHDTQTTEKESGKLEHSNEDDNITILEKVSKQNSAENGIRDTSSSNIIGQMVVTGSLKETTGVKIPLPNSLKAANISKSMATNGNSHLEADSSVTDSTEIGNNASKDNDWLNRTTGAGQNTSMAQPYIESAGSFLQNGVEKLSESEPVQNPTASGTVTGTSEDMRFQKLSQDKNTVSGETQSNTNPVTTGSTENNVTAGENSIGLETPTESVTRSEATEETEKNLRTPDTRENDGATKTESKGNIHSSNNNESLSSLRTGTLDAPQHDPIDALDSEVHQEVAQARTDIDTLPDVRTGADTGDETATE